MTDIRRRIDNPQFGCGSGDANFRTGCFAIDGRAAMYRRILVPFDGSGASLRGLDEAVGLALPLGATLRLVHVIHKFDRRPGHAGPSSYIELVPGSKEAGELLLRQGRGRAEHGGVKVQTMLLASLTGQLSEMVAEEARAWRADLIVIGTHGRRGVERILWGSDAEQLMRIAPVPVLLVQAARRPTEAPAERVGSPARSGAMSRP
jgi:nucleotide-binding universal stress UspA family protein